MHAPVPEHDPETLYEAAESFVRRCYSELDRESEIEPRLEEIRESIDERGHYEHTADELEHGARMAWRNSNRCIGRLFWKRLDVVDARDRTTADGVFEALCDHLEYATNDGNVRPTITIFPPMVRGDRQVRIWNYQLVRYAGYPIDDNETDRSRGDEAGDRRVTGGNPNAIGDPDEIELTKYCLARGWEGDRTDFDVLPLVIQIEDREPTLYELPEELVLEVPIEHPEHDWMPDIGLRWYAVPVVSNMRLSIGGLQYTAAPFNGWYMATEIAARNFADEDRYDMLPAVADRLGLDTSRNRNLWKDEALVALNRAVLYSYEREDVTIVDHHTAAEQFESFEQNEADAGRDVTGDWSWLIPPMSPATTHVFHEKYDDTIETPNFFYPERELPEAAIEADS